MSLALVPVKALPKAKSRMDAAFAHAEREALATAMLRDVLEALAAAPSVARRVVVTPDARVAEVARAWGAEPWVDARPLNDALEAAVAALAAADEPVLVVLGDVAGALPEDLEALHAALAELGGRGAVMVPASDGGTGALLRAPADVFACAFGPKSADAHRERARRAGAPLRELPLASLALDLDSADDVKEFLARDERGGAHTRAVLEELGWPR